MKNKLPLTKALLTLGTVLSINASINAQTYIITTIAGTGTAGSSGDGGQATAAELNGPNGVSVDRLGNVCIADNFNCRARVVNPVGVISTFAGTGTSGYSGDGGPATAAKISSFAIGAYDPSNVHFAFALPVAYLADFYGNRVRFVNSAGVITTVAGTGSGVSSGDGGPATAAGIDGPFAVAADGQGNLYIAEDYRNTIRKVNPSGIITTYAGNGYAGNTGNGGPATAAEMDQPTAVTVDAAGNVYFCDAINMVVRKINTSGIISLVAGGGGAGFSGDGGQATNAKLLWPYGVAVDPYGNIYVLDAGNKRVRMVNNAGIITTIAGGGTSTANGIAGTSAILNQPTGVAVDQYGTVYISESGDNKVRKLSLPSFTLTASQIATGPCGSNIQAATATVSGGLPPYTYLWSPGGQTTKTIGSQAPGSYTVTVTDSRGAQLIQAITLGCTISGGGGLSHQDVTNNNTTVNTVSIYPNPSKGLFNIKYAPQGSVIELYNELGVNEKTVISAGDETTFLDTSNLPNGIYFVRISNTDGSIISQQKIIKVQ
jgi:hypothetical protein